VITVAPARDQRRVDPDRTPRAQGF